MQNGFIERWWNVWGKFGLELAEEKVRLLLFGRFDIHLKLLGS
jgi:hypothetical protein